MIRGRDIGMHQPSDVLEILFALLSLLAIWFAFSNFNSFKRVLIGRPMRTAELNSKHNKLIWYIALPILSADLYSSVSYGPESGITELIKLGNEAKWLEIGCTL